MVLKLYYFDGSPGVRAVLIAAKALNIEFKLHHLDYLKQEHLSPEFRQINPQHTVPTLDDDGNVLWDSHAIMAYLVGKFGKNDSLYPKDIKKRVFVDQRLHYDSGNVYPLMKKIDYAYIDDKVTEVPLVLKNDALEVYQVLERFLEGAQWIAGNNVTIADFSLAPTILSLNYHIRIDPESYPKLTSWIGRVKTLPCFEVDVEQEKFFASFFDDLKSKFAK